MCDTLYVPAHAATDGVAIFAKNSDREPNEAQFIEIIPARDHPPGASVKCTYIEVPQVRHTYAVILSRPFWMWGAEMGVNEHGLAIGNEAVFTRMPYQKKGGLTGMDLLRLALERCQTATQAVELITEFLATYGQGGNCGYKHKFYYHNSFLIATAKEAWILETAGREWAARKIQNVEAISNVLSIGKEWDRASLTLVNTAIAKGWCKKEDDFHFARCYSEKLYSHFSFGEFRRECSLRNLANKNAQLHVKDLMHFLRDHGTDEENFHPAHGLSKSSVCMHASFGPIRRSQTTASLVVYLTAEKPLVFYTGTSAPCLSIFKPLWFDVSIPQLLQHPGAVFDANTLFWSHELLHRETLKDFPTRYALIRQERDSIEEEFVEKALHIHGKSPEIRQNWARQCFEKSLILEEQWLQRVQQEPIRHKAPLFYRLTWHRWNRQAKVPISLNQ